MQQYIQIGNIDVLKRILIEILKDLPGIHQLKGKSVSHIVKKVNEYNQHLQVQITKSRKEMQISRRTDNTEMQLQLINLREKNNAFLLVNYILLRDKELFATILNEV